MSLDDFKDLDALTFPKNVYHVNEDGGFTKRLYPDVKMENTMFWRRKSRLVAFLVGFPTLAFVMILLAETNMLQNIWDGILSFVGLFI